MAALNATAAATIEDVQVAAAPDHGIPTPDRTRPGLGLKFEWSDDARCAA
jgi:hypothetical protein